MTSSRLAGYRIECSIPGCGRVADCASAGGLVDSIGTRFMELQFLCLAHASVTPAEVWVALESDGFVPNQHVFELIGEASGAPRRWLTARAR